MSSSSASSPSSLPSELASVLRGHSAPLQFARFSPNGRYAITGGQDKRVMLWNPFRCEEVEADEESTAAAAAGAAPTALLIATYAAHGYEVLDAALSADGATLASVGGDRAAVVWDTARVAVLRKLSGHEQRVSTTAMASEAGGGAGALLATGSDDKTVRLWDLRAAGRAAQTLSEASDNVTAVALARGCVFAASLDGSVRRYDVRAARLLRDEVGAGVAALALSGDGACLLAGTLRAGGELLLLEAARGLRLKAYAGHANALYRCAPAFSADDAHVLCGGEDGAVTWWDLVSARAVHRLADAHRRVVSWVSPHPNPDTPALLTASYDGTAKLWLAPGRRRELMMS